MSTKAVLYLRYSSDKQTEQSIEGQERVCSEYCKRNDIEITGIYIDRALSASKNTEKREQFQQMIRDSDKQSFDAVIVYKLDRFARNRYDSATYKAKLKKNGVRVISAAENISDSPEGIILESVLEGMAEFYSKELAQKVTRGLNETERAIRNLMGLAEKGIAVESVMNRPTEPEAKRKSPESELDGELSKIVILDQTQVEWWLTRFANGDKNDPSYRRKLVNMLITSVTVYDNPDGTFDVTILYTLKSCHPKIVKLSDLRIDEPKKRQVEACRFFIYCEAMMICNTSCW